MLCNEVKSTESGDTHFSQVTDGYQMVANWSQLLCDWSIYIISYIRKLIAEGNLFFVKLKHSNELLFSILMNNLSVTAIMYCGMVV